MIHGSTFLLRNSEPPNNIKARNDETKLRLNKDAGNETSITFHWIDHPDAAVDAVISYKMVITTLTASGGLNWGGSNTPTSMTLLELGS